MKGADWGFAGILLGLTAGVDALAAPRRSTLGIEKVPETLRASGTSFCSQC